MPAPLSLATIALTLAFDTFIIVVIFRRVFVHKQPTAETIYGALCIYLLVGLGFASIYSLLATLQPHAFYLDPATDLNPALNRFDLIYYSFGTMTCLGPAGIAAVSNQARSLSLIEAILGVLYLAVLISQTCRAPTHNVSRAKDSDSRHASNPFHYIKSETNPNECSRNNWPACRKSPARKASMIG